MGLRQPDPYTGPTTKGIDVSFYQGVISWTKVKAAGIDFVFSRVGDGLHVDSTFNSNFRNSKATGLIPGAYQFMRPSEDPVDQAMILCKALTAAGYNPKTDLPPALDVERGDGTDDPHHVADQMLVWINYVRNTLKVTPIIYAGAFFAQFVHDPRLSVFPLWTPCYTTVPMVPKTWQHWTFWQYTSSGPATPGIHGAVDKDIFRGGLTTLQLFITNSQVTTP